jgi:hypothetical protein
MKRAAQLLFALSLLWSSATALAEAKNEREARVLFREGNLMLQEKEYLGALERFRAAYERFPNPKILLNIGTTLRHLGRDAEAADLYEKYLASAKPTAARRAEVEAILSELSQRLAKLRIQVNEAGARVLVDGKPVGESPQPVTMRVEAGTHTVVAEKEGFSTAVTTVDLAGGQSRTIELQLTRPGTAAGSSSLQVANPAGSAPLEKPADAPTVSPVGVVGCASRAS